MIITRSNRHSGAIKDNYFFFETNLIAVLYNQPTNIYVRKKKSTSKLSMTMYIYIYTPEKTKYIVGTAFIVLI